MNIEATNLAIVICHDVGGEMMKPLFSIAYYQMQKIMNT